MKRLFTTCLALALLVPGYAFAQSAFTGTWKLDVSSAEGTGRPEVVHLKDGMFECNCVPPVKVKADGADHAVAGHPGFDTVAVKVLNDHSYQETFKKDGKVVSTSTATVAADGKTATVEFADHGPSPMSGTLLVDRIGPRTPGANAADGIWAFDHYTRLSGGLLTGTYKVDGDKVSYSDLAGDSYTAKLDGKPVPYTSGDGASGMTVSVERVGNDGLRETYYRNGKVTSWDTMTVAADGKSMKSVNHNVKESRAMTSVAYKQ